MGRAVYLAVLMSVLAGCVPIAKDPARDEFGLSVVRPDAGTTPPAAPEQAKLVWKASQICVHGSTQTNETIEPAEADRQIIDRKIRCGHYDSWDFDYVRMSWGNLL